MEEIEWRPVVGYEGLYDVSSDGQIRNARTGKTVKRFPRKDGYLTVSLYRRKTDTEAVKQKAWLVHRLVAIAFIPNPDNFKEIDHIDGCCTNNAVCNLRWCDRLTNIMNPVTFEKYKEAVQSKAHRELCSKVKDPKKKPVRCVETDEVWESVHAAARALGLTQTTIQQSCKYAEAPTYRKLKQMGGKPVKHFEFITKEEYDARLNSIKGSTGIG